MTLDGPGQSSHPGKKYGLEFPESDIIEEACQAIEEGIWVIKLLIPQRMFRTAEKTEISGTEVWRIRRMRKCCHLNASDFDRSLAGVVTFTNVHGNKDVLHDSLTPALIAARVNGRLQREPYRSPHRGPCPERHPHRNCCCISI
jgi:hypothetical protein